jgi:hypothetical protein
MRKINRQDVLKIVLVLALVGGVGMSMAAVGRFTPTHAIVEPVYCGSCHPDQVIELNATTHLPHFSGAVYQQAEAMEAGGAATVTQAEAISGGCMMCHNTWNNREKIFVTGYNLTSQNNQTELSYNDITFTNTNASSQFDVAVTSASQFIRLGTGVSGIKVSVQDPGTSGVVAGTALKSPADYTANTTGITLVGSTNVTALNGTGALKITYNVAGNATDFKTVWGDLSALSPTPGYFNDDKTGTASCGNPEKGLCHITEIAVGKNTMNTMLENQAGGTGVQLGSGNGIYFQHEMSYTSAEYAAKQVKLCGVCHVNKLPPMDANGEPIRQDVAGARLVRVSHGTNLIDTQNLTLSSSEWAHRQVQCIRCHSHAGIGGEDAITGVRSP